MLYGIVDAGSNSIRLCVYDVEEKSASFTCIYDKKHMAGLAGFVDEGGRLTSKGVKRAQECISNHLEKCDALGVARQNVHVFATASIRNTVNSADVVSAIEAQCGCSVDLLSGEEEARLGFNGAMMSCDAKDGVLLDIGGGSSEVTLFRNGSIKHSYSIPHGSLSMFMGKVGGLLPTVREIQEIQSLIRNQVDSVKKFRGQWFDAIYAVGGSARATYKLAVDLFPESVNGRCTSVECMQQMMALASRGDKAALLRILSVAPERVHTLFPGMAIEMALASYFGAKEVEVLRYGIREGYLLTKVLG